MLAPYPVLGHGHVVRSDLQSAWHVPCANLVLRSTVKSGRAGKSCCYIINVCCCWHFTMPAANRYIHPVTWQWQCQVTYTLCTGLDLSDGFSASTFQGNRLYCIAHITRSSAIAGRPCDTSHGPCDTSHGLPAIAELLLPLGLLNWTWKWQPRLKWPWNVLQGHQKWHQSKANVWFPISSL